MTTSGSTYSSTGSPSWIDTTTNHKTSERSTATIQLTRFDKSNSHGFQASSAGRTVLRTSRPSTSCKLSEASPQDSPTHARCSKEDPLISRRRSLSVPKDSRERTGWSGRDSCNHLPQPRACQCRITDPGLLDQPIFDGRGNW